MIHSATPSILHLGKYINIQVFAPDEQRLVKKELHNDDIVYMRTPKINTKHRIPPNRDLTSNPIIRNKSHQN
jgi:hypothetical protein